MAMSVTRRMTPDGDAIFYDPKFRQVLETHMAYLRQLWRDNIVGLDDQMVFKYEGDFFGLLSALKVKMEYHWLVMRLNDMTSPADLRLGLLSIIIPTNEDIESIRRVHQTINKKTI